MILTTLFHTGSRKFGLSAGRRQAWRGKRLCEPGRRRRQLLRLEHQSRSQSKRQLPAKNRPRRGNHGGEPAPAPMPAPIAPPTARPISACSPRLGTEVVETRTTSSRFTEISEPFSFIVSSPSVTVTNFPSWRFNFDSITSIPCPAFRLFKLDQELFRVSAPSEPASPRRNKTSSTILRIVAS